MYTLQHTLKANSIAFSSGKAPLCIYSHICCQGHSGSWSLRLGWETQLRGWEGLLLGLDLCWKRSRRSLGISTFSLCSPELRRALQPPACQPYKLRDFSLHLEDHPWNQRQDVFGDPEPGAPPQGQAELCLGAAELTKTSALHSNFIRIWSQGDTPLF